MNLRLVYEPVRLRRKRMKYFAIIAITILLGSISACSPGQLFGSTLTPTPTSTLAPTIPFTPTPTNTPTLTPTLVPDGPCDNPLIPLRPGNQWFYQVTTTSGESSYNIKSLGIEKGGNIVALVEYFDQKKGLTIKDNGICQEGMIKNYPLFEMNMLFTGYLDIYIDAVHISGISAPNYQTLTQNNWTSNWQAVHLTEDNAYIRNPFGEADLWIPFGTQIDISNNLDGSWESITTPAGNFPHALKLTQDITLPVTITAGNESGTGAVLKINITQWYEPYIGLVRAQVTSASLDGVNFPLESTLILVEFTPGK
jgi:hypothetical protein